jgi:hypothetical protein
MNQSPTAQFLQQILAASVGPGSTPGMIQRVQLWDVFYTLPFYNDSDLAGKTFTMFNAAKNQQVTGPGFVTASPAYNLSSADTNLDAPGNLPFDLFIHGLSFDIITRQQTPGTVGTANDLANFPPMKAAYLSDLALALNINNNDLDLFTAIEAPAGAGMWGSFAQGTTAALTVGASMGATSNGWPAAGNYRNYANEGPFYCPTNTTLKLNGQFGNSILTGSTTYKPVSTGAPALFLKCVLRGFRVWYAS